MSRPWTTHFAQCGCQLLGQILEHETLVNLMRLEVKINWLLKAFGWHIVKLNSRGRMHKVLVFISLLVLAGCQPWQDDLNRNSMQLQDLEARVEC